MDSQTTKIFSQNYFFKKLSVHTNNTADITENQRSLGSKLTNFNFGFFN